VLELAEKSRKEDRLKRKKEGFGEMEEGEGKTRIAI